MRFHRIILHFVDEAVEELKNRTHDADGEESILEKLTKINKTVAVIMSADSLLAGQ